MQKEKRSFVYLDTIADIGLIRDARAAGFDVNVIYLGTEDPNLNIGRILIRLSNGGVFAPLGRVAKDSEKGVKQLRKISKQVGDLILFDNTPNGRGVRLVAHFQNGKLARMARAVPKWARAVLGNGIGRRSAI